MDWKQTIAEIAQEIEQKEIARLCGTDPPTISKLKTGETRRCEYHLGCALVDLHRKVKRRQARRV